MHQLNVKSCHEIERLKKPFARPISGSNFALNQWSLETFEVCFIDKPADLMRNLTNV
jgi:hypothetical protein